MCATNMMGHPPISVGAVKLARPCIHPEGGHLEHLLLTHFNIVTLMQTESESCTNFYLSLCAAILICNGYK